MQIIDENALELVRRFPFCEICGWKRPENILLEPHHLLSRGFGGGTRLDLVWAMVASCGFYPARNCHRHVHDGNIPLMVSRTAVAYRIGVTREELDEALTFMKWVPNRPIAGTVKKQYKTLSQKAKGLVLPHIEELIS